MILRNTGTEQALGNFVSQADTGTDERHYEARWGWDFVFVPVSKTDLGLVSKRRRRESPT